MNHILITALKSVVAEPKGPQWVEPSVDEMIEEFQDEQSAVYEWLDDDKRLAKILKEGDHTTIQPKDIPNKFKNLGAGDLKVPDNWLDPDTTEEAGTRYNPEHHDELIPDMIEGGKVTMPIVYTDDLGDLIVLGGRHRINYAYQCGTSD